MEEKKEKLPSQVCFLITEKDGTDWMLCNYIMRAGKAIFPKSSSYLKFPA
ncbi:MAG: hypothetical protein Q7K35_00975 [bacterium]|nr:hypothetical protein [bacterium]